MGAFDDFGVTLYRRKKFVTIREGFAVKENNFL